MFYESYCYFLNLPWAEKFKALKSSYGKAAVCLGVE
jgi:hypothetical protein